MTVSNSDTMIQSLYSQASVVHGDACAHSSHWVNDGPCTGSVRTVEPHRVSSSL